MFRHILKKNLLPACVLASGAWALEISDLHLPMTRTEADESLTKDYTYQVLQDATIRRSWGLDGKTVTIDFDPVTNEAICIVVTYKPDIARKKGMADAKTMSHGKAEGAKWLNTKSAAAKKFGMKNSKVLPLTDGSYLFREEDESGKKFTRLSLFAKAPKGNRWELPTLELDNRTALGTTVQNDNIKELFRDEERRLNSGGAAVASTETPDVKPKATPVAKPVVSALGSTPGARKASAGTAPKPTKEPEKLADIATAESDDAEEPTSSPGLAATLGLDHPGSLQYGIGGGILLLLIILIGARVSAARRKARQRAQYASVLLNSKPTSKIKRR